MKFKSFADLISQVKGKSNRVVVPGANNKEALAAIKMAMRKGVVILELFFVSGVLIVMQRYVRLFK